jgi:hypothetical protein
MGRMQQQALRVRFPCMVVAVALVVAMIGYSSLAEVRHLRGSELQEINDGVKSLPASLGSAGKPVETVEQLYASHHPVYVGCAKVFVCTACVSMPLSVCHGTAPTHERRSRRAQRGDEC